MDVGESLVHLNSELFSSFAANVAGRLERMLWSKAAKIVTSKCEDTSVIKS